MRRNKSAFTVSLAVVLSSLMLLTGCGSNNASTPEASAPAAESSAAPKTDAGETKKLVVTSFGGDYEKAQIEYAVKPFEKEFNAKVEVVTLYSADALARIRAEKNAQTIDVVQFSGGQEVQAAKEGLIQKIDSSVLTNQKDLYANALNKDGYGPSLAFDALGIIYNEQKITTPPTSWEDLWKPEYKGHVGLVDITNTFGLQFLVMNSMMAGGDESKMDPGFEKIKTLLPNTAAVVASTPDVGNLFAQEEAWIAPYDSGYAFNFRKQGQPIKFVMPKEGGMATFINAQVVEGSKNPELAKQFVNYLLRPEVQKAFAEQTGFAPTNQTVQLDPELASVIPYGAEAVAELVPLNWEVVNQNREKWNETWSKLISK
ncbi:MAG: ABC transporter substrate-binding protein [Clostridia bacterium]